MKLALFCLAVVCILSTVRAGRQKPVPSIFSDFEKARQRLYQIPAPMPDEGLATRVSDCISGKLQDNNSCERSIIAFNQYIVDMYTRSRAIRDAEHAGLRAVEEAAKMVESHEQQTRPL